MHTQMTKSQIRSTLLSRPDTIKVRITRAGDVHVYTSRPRGDGGQTPHWIMAGRVGDPAYRIESP